MAEITPFRAVRPKKNLVHLIASRSVDNYQINALKQKLSENPYTFLHIIKPDFSKNGSLKSAGFESLNKIRAKYEKFTSEYFIKDEHPSYYIYKQSNSRESYIGIIACASIADYEKGVIKVHEQTLTDKEIKLSEYLDVCNFNAEPVCMMYEENSLINSVIDKYMFLPPEYHFTTTDQKDHELRIVSNPNDVATIREAFSKIEAIYIADGHHRSASSVRLGKERLKKNPNDPAGKYMCIFFTDHQLKIYDYNRLVTDLNHLSLDQFISKLHQHFEVFWRGENIVKPTEIHDFSLYIDKNWYLLRLKPHVLQGKDLTHKLDAGLLTDLILHPILGIQDLKTDKRIGFINGLKGAEGIKKQVDTGKFALGFGLFPVQMNQLKAIADNNMIMPPKTTWVEPKLRSGLTIYELT
jgi:uncharacterized protein (DUF1015 family)